MQPTSRDPVRHRKQHSKLSALGDTFANHFAIPGFEYVQRELSAGKENDVQGEKRNAIWPHKSHRT